jgi:hypothetical protein
MSEDEMIEKISAKELFELLLSASNAGVDLEKIHLVKPLHIDDFFVFGRIRSMEIQDNFLILE